MFLFKKKGNGESSESNALRIRKNLENDGPNAVNLLMYDMSNGKTRSKSMLLTGVGCVEGVWHVGVYVFGVEWGYSSKGIRSSPPLEDRETCDFPERVEKVGETSRSFPEFTEFIEELSSNLFEGRNYNVVRHNCIIFSHILCKILCGVGVPKYLLDLPDTVVGNAVLANENRQTCMPSATFVFKLWFLQQVNTSPLRARIVSLLDNVPPSQMLSFLRELR